MIRQAWIDVFEFPEALRVPFHAMMQTSHLPWTCRKEGMCCWYALAVRGSRRQLRALWQRLRHAGITLLSRSPAGAWNPQEPHLTLHAQRLAGEEVSRIVAWNLIGGAQWEDWRLMAWNRRAEQPWGDEA